MDEKIFLSVTRDELKNLIKDSLAELLQGNENYFPEKKELLTAKEASKLLGCSRSHLTKSVQKGLITCQHLGKRIYFSRAELLNQIRRGDKHESA